MGNIHFLFFLLEVKVLIIKIPEFAFSVNDNVSDNKLYYIIFILTSHLIFTHKYLPFILFSHLFNFI